MKVNVLQLLAALIVGVAAGMLFRSKYEGFSSNDTQCSSCGRKSPCDCPTPRPVCAPCEPCREPDMSRYILRSTIPSCPTCPDLSMYLLKSEVPPAVDLSQYVLKASIPKQQPVILDCSKCNKPKGDCPPCPRARCPEVKCAPPTKCPACAPCPRAECPPAVVKCKAEEQVVDGVRPFLAPLNFRGFGMN